MNLDEFFGSGGEVCLFFFLLSSDLCKDFTKLWVVINIRLCVTRRLRLSLDSFDREAAWNDWLDLLLCWLSWL